MLIVFSLVREHFVMPVSTVLEESWCSQVRQLTGRIGKLNRACGEVLAC